MNSDGESLTASAALYPGLSVPPPASATSRLRGNHALNCSQVYDGYDVATGERTPSAPNGLNVSSVDECCAKCEDDDDCTTFVFSSDSEACDGDKDCTTFVYAQENPDPDADCWLLAHVNS